MTTAYAYPGWGEFARENLHYSQAVRVGDVLHLSGQGGWIAEKKEVDINEVIVPGLGNEIDQAFYNVDNNLRHAGAAQGFQHVYKITTYSTDLPSQHEHIVRNLKKWNPSAAHVWTEVGVKELGAPTMHFEIEVEAYDPEGSAKLRASKA